MSKEESVSTRRVSRRGYADRDIKLLWGLAAGRCSRCRCVVVAEGTTSDPHTIVGEIAHIVAHGDHGPRSDPALQRADRDKYENLILLCPNDHTIVDKQDSTYTVDDLKRWKRDHERWVSERLREEVPGIGFAELEVVTSALLRASITPSADFVVLDPAEKMRRNGLTDAVRLELMLGLAKAPEVEAFVVHVGMMDPDFPERLKAGFVQEYRRLRSLGVEGDALFAVLADFSAAGHSEFRYLAAGRAVLAHLFEKCEVFER